MIGLIFIPLAAAAVWFNRVAITRSVVFGGLARAVELQLGKIDFAAAMPQPVVTYAFPRVDVFVTSVAFTDPAVRLVAIAPGTLEFGLTLQDLLIHLSTDGLIKTSGSCFARTVVISGELRVSSDLASARASVWESRVIDFSLQLDQTLGAVTSGLAASYKADIQAKVETSIRAAIEEQLPPIVIDYINKYPTAAEAVMGLIETAASDD